MKQLVMNPTVPHTPARQRMVLDSIPRDLYKIAVREVSLALELVGTKTFTLIVLKGDG